MYGIARDVLLALYQSLKQFWKALLRFGSPRFTVETLNELRQIEAANDEDSNDDIDSQCQLQAA